jgi:hypothetical protein
VLGQQALFFAPYQAGGTEQPNNQATVWAFGICADMQLDSRSELNTPPGLPPLHDIRQC